MLMEKRTNEAKNQISSIAMEENLKKEVLTGFNIGLKKRESNFKEYFRIERAFLAECDDLLTFLLTRTGKYRFKNGQIIFYSDSDVERFNKFTQKIDNLIKEESTWLDKYRESLLSNAQKLDQISNKK
jgi:hypothetical protein